MHKPFLQPAKRRRTQQGFALPSIMIASVVMLTVLLTSIGATASVRTSISSQYYTQLAKEAAESGALRARECLEANGHVVTWSNGSPLRPYTNCDGSSIAGACPTATSPGCFVTSKSNLRTSFSVGDTSVAAGIAQVIDVTGTLELLRSSTGAPYVTQTSVLSSKVGVNATFNTVKFGYGVVGGVGEPYFITTDANGTLRAVGGNSAGQLGTGSTTTALTPVPLIMPTGITLPAKVYTAFQPQGTAIFLVDAVGNVYAGGLNTNGRIGNGTTDSPITAPVRVSMGMEKAAQIEIGGANTYIITQSNNVYAIGACSYGRLGDGLPTTGCSDSLVAKRVVLPAYNAGDPNTKPIALESDGWSAYVLMEGGAVYGWGANWFGQLAVNPFALFETSTPRRIGVFGNPSQPDVVQMATDGGALYVLDDLGRVMAVGENTVGQLGNGSVFPFSHSFVQFDLSACGGVARKVVTDYRFVSVLTSNGSVCSAGQNDVGQLGNGSTSSAVSTPVRFQLPVSVQAKDVYNTSPGDSHYANTLVLGNDDKVYGAGSNSFGQLGTGESIVYADYRSTPVVMNMPVDATGIQIGFGTSVIQGDDSKIYTTGRNSHGQLGDGTTINRSTPKASKYTNILPVTNF